MTTTGLPSSVPATRPEPAEPKGGSRDAGTRKREAEAAAGGDEAQQQTEPAVVMVLRLQIQSSCWSAGQAEP